MTPVYVESTDTTGFKVFRISRVAVLFAFFLSSSTIARCTSSLVVVVEPDPWRANRNCGVTLFLDLDLT